MTMLRKTTELAHRRPALRWAATLLGALVALEILLPTGCIGFQAITGDKMASSRRRVGATLILPEAYGLRDSVSTPAEALRAWGEPRRRKVRADGRQVWKYRQPDMRWRGVVMWALIVPVPLLVPTGRRKVWLEFANDSLTRVTTQYTGDKCYGLFMFEGRAGRPMPTFQVH